MNVAEELIKLLPTAGVGGIIAALMFYFYRKDSLENVTRFERISQDFKDVIRENTIAIVELRAKLDNR